MTNILAGRRLVIAHNPHSSRARHVNAAVFRRLDEVGYKYTVIDVQRASLNDNVQRVSALLQPHDIVLSVGGDGSAHAVAHAVMAATQPDIVLGFLGFGNFNDLAHTINSRASRQDPVALLETGRIASLRPLDVLINGTKLRSALLYATIGWTARAANQFDDPNIRQRIQKKGTSTFKNIWRLGWYYLASRRVFLPEFTHNSRVFGATTDILCVNGQIMARLFKTRKRYYASEVFLTKFLNVSRLVPNILFLVKGLLGRLPGSEVQDIKVVFTHPANIPLQCDGEVLQIEDVRELQVAKSTHSIQILTSK